MSLVELFNINKLYGDLRTSVLQNLTTVDFDNLRQTCGSIDHCLMEPTTNNPPRSRYLPDTIDRCDEIGLPAPPSIGLRGACPNPSQCTVRIRYCQHADFPALTQAPACGSNEYLVCEVCRRNWHDNIGRNPRTAIINPFSRHDWWRLRIASGHVTVCKLCDREQKSQHHPEGHDGCICYREYYKKRWLSRPCDIRNGDDIAYRIDHLAQGVHRQRLKQVGDHMVDTRVRQGKANLPQGQFQCPCGRRVSEAQPPAIQAGLIQRPWQGNHNLITSVAVNPRRPQEPLYFTKQCVMCCKYIVPPHRGRPGAAPVRQPTRRSARVADQRSGTQRARKHTMLDRTGKAAARHGVNSNGFEVRRARGGHD